MTAHGHVQSAARGQQTAPPPPPLPQRPAPSPPPPPAGVTTLTHQLLVFTLDDQQFGLRLPAVERVERAVEITPLPEAPEIVLGVLNLRGRIIPVVDIRKRFRLPARALTLRDRLIVARTARRPVALLVDAVEGVVESSAAAVIAAAEILPGLAYVEGVVKLDDGALLIHDLDRFLSLEEDQALAAAILTGTEAVDGAA
jgi:purine-binding chemotaxis protein CheW